MRSSSFLHVLRAQLREHRKLFIQTMCVVAFLVMALVATVALTNGVSALVNKAREQFPPGQLVLKPKAISMSVLKFQVGDITDETLKSVREIPGVEQVSAQLGIKMPMKADVSLFGQQAVSDIVLLGIDSEMVANDVFPGERFAYDQTTSEPIPVVVPTLFLDLFNLAYADSMGLPKMSTKVVSGRRFTLHCGESFVFGSGGEIGKTAITPILCRIVGVTDAPGLNSGGYIPMEAAKYLNGLIGKQDSRYTSAFVRSSPDKSPTVEATVREMGFLVEGNGEILAKINFAALLVSGLIVVFSLIVTAIAGLSLLNLYSVLYNSRRSEIGVMLCIGGTRSLVLVLALCEIFVTTLFAGIVGGSVALFGLWQADIHLMKVLPQMSFVPTNLLMTTPADVVTVVVCVTLVCMGAAMPTLLKTTVTAPSRLIH